MVSERARASYSATSLRYASSALLAFAVIGWAAGLIAGLLVLVRADDTAGRMAGSGILLGSFIQVALLAVVGFAGRAYAADLLDRSA